MKVTSIAPELIASTSSPELDATKNSTGTPGLRLSSFPRSTGTPRGSPSASLTTKRADFAGAAATPTRNFPVGAISCRCDGVRPSGKVALPASVAKRSAEQNRKSFMRDWDLGLGTANAHEYTILNRRWTQIKE